MKQTKPFLPHSEVLATEPLRCGGRALTTVKVVSRRGRHINSVRGSGRFREAARNRIAAGCPYTTRPAVVISASHYPLSARTSIQTDDVPHRENEAVQAFSATMDAAGPRLIRGLRLHGLSQWLTTAVSARTILGSHRVLTP